MVRKKLQENSSIPVAGELQQLRDNLYRLCAPNPSQMTGPGTNTYIYGVKELAVLDPGPPIDAHVDRILAAQDELQAPITRIIATHTHRDHSPAVALLAQNLPAVEIIGAPAAHDLQNEDLSFEPTQVPIDDQLIQHEANVIRALHTPGHVGNHFCYLFEEHKMLATGDHLMSGSTVVIIPPKGSMRDYVSSLRKLHDYDIQVMAPGHGPLIEQPMQLVDWTIEHRLQREAKVFAALSNQAQNLDELVLVAYDDVDAGIHWVAKYSLHAHLIKLVEEDRVQATTAGWWVD